MKLNEILVISTLFNTFNLLIIFVIHAICKSQAIIVPRRTYSDVGNLSHAHTQYNLQAISDNYNESVFLYVI